MVLIDIREKGEIYADPCGREGSIDMPMSQFNSKKLFSTKHYALFCQRGKRSAELVRELRKFGIQNVHSVEGGIDSLRCLW